MGVNHRCPIHRWMQRVQGRSLLFVVGPERLPAIAGYFGKWFGKLQRYFFEVKDAIQRETVEPTNEINKLLDDQKSSMDRIEKEIENKKKEEE